MRPKLDEWLARIKAVEREHSAMRLGIERLLADGERDSSILPRELPRRVVRLASERLDGTYVIRLFAEFETGLRLFWPAARGTDSPSRTRDLLDGVAATRRIPHDQLKSAHRVRECRNSLLHVRAEPASPISIAEARRHLCRFFSFLPPRW